MKPTEQLSAVDFYRYPPIGAEDWRYAYATAEVRVLETMMPSRTAFVDMANAETFQAALELLGGTEYAQAQSADGFAQIEQMLLEKRFAVRRLFIDLMLDDDLIEPLRAQEDFANMRLAVRRVVTEKPIGLDYSNDGSVPAEEFEEIFQQENYSRFPQYLQDAVEEAVLGYYQEKDIRRIDYGIDKVQAAYKLQRAQLSNSIFLKSLFRTQIDLTNIRTILRLKMAERSEKQFFLDGGFVETGRFVAGLDSGYEAIAPLFYATCYHEILDDGINYLTTEQSFLRLEALCEQHLMGFLKTTATITSGPQPLIAYLMTKENEIRTVRMVLTGKKNGLDNKLILDRLGQ